MDTPSNSLINYNRQRSEANGHIIFTEQAAQVASLTAQLSAKESQVASQRSALKVIPKRVIELEQQQHGPETTLQHSPALTFHIYPDQPANQCHIFQLPLHATASVWRDAQTSTGYTMYIPLSDPT